MTITAETFESEHFEKLLRGLTVASEAFVERGREIEALEGQKEDLQDLVDDLREEVYDLKAQARPFDELIEFIGDVERGLQTPDELFERTRELAAVFA